MIHVLHTDSFVSYYPRYQINNMKAKLSENSLFGDSDRDEIRGGGDATVRPPPTKARNTSSQMVSGGQSSLIFFPTTLSTDLINFSM